MQSRARGGRPRSLRLRIPREWRAAPCCLRPLQHPAPPAPSEHLLPCSPAPAGYRGSAGYSGETHFNVEVVSSRFEGLTSIKRHRLVYQILEAEMRRCGCSSVCVCAFPRCAADAHVCYHALNRIWRWGWAGRSAVL